ncbi:bifunctional ADP-dependent NAD(P)H-hydrate dehydratase/NAD(P)H-hydrate epimerase [Hydrogenovibrio halophilus]|uniref:bifunctional ADP-dependent NAD(P)H-hydrate dehydratase/NAD(P)H-hydrate epimerase n=1 Tax=Hydrogenovibrio halophilus TaxID=373391 RepID=UPI00037D1E6C|nr:bifunctional ADP-dependent NAD(P)H-hydrate dehydratase/NAD(P)H-hydrate epimerase [Hydrogenovibrio halophilus]
MAQAFYSAQQSRALDQKLIQNGVFPGITLMKRAGMAATEYLKQQWPAPCRLLILCGGGNNGGDGFVVAQFAALQGYEVTVALFAQPERYQGDAATVLQEVTDLGIQPVPFHPDLLSEADLLVDAILGTGLTQAVKPALASLFDPINQSGKPVLALDLPSGLNADTGAIMGHAIRADATVTFITRKLGLTQHQGPDTAGRVHYADLNLPETAWPNVGEAPPLAQAHDGHYWWQQRPPRPLASHKGTAGTALLIGGNHSMSGALQMAASACLKSGTGLVKLVTRSEHSPTLTAQQPEWMLYDERALSQLAESASALGIGPGLGQDDWAKGLFDQACLMDRPKVLDADALNWLAQFPRHRDDWVLTPHPGEAARLLNTDSAQIQQDRLAAVKALQQQYGGVVVLKGRGTLIYDGEHCEVCLAGNPGMATGGMGDVLTGLITAWLAQGMAAFDAACLGVWLHAEGGDALYQRYGVRGVLPSELSDCIRRLMAETMAGKV